jgi:hypothetical protein
LAYCFDGHSLRGLSKSVASKLSNYFPFLNEIITKPKVLPYPIMKESEFYRYSENASLDEVLHVLLFILIFIFF